MEKRKIIFGSYDTAAHGWTLASWTLSAPEMQTNLVEVPGRRKGPLDLSTALTDGEPVYGSREMVANLECSEGTRLNREATIDPMANWLDGGTMNITLPDDAGHYLTGRVHVVKDYNDPAHAAVTVSAVCEPWRYAAAEKTITLTAAMDAQTATLTNAGRLALVPLLVVAGDAAEVNLVRGTASWALAAGTYALPDLLLTQGDHTITYSGTGTLTFTWREGVL